MKNLFRLPLLLTLWLGICGTGAALGAFESTAEGVDYQDLSVGQGDAAAEGDVAVMHFVGWLAEDGARGREIFNTRNRGEPVAFVVGTDKVMPGWNHGIIGMRPGGRRLLLIPPGLAYRDTSRPAEIPADMSLMFLIELVAVEKPAGP
jgi:FKBP-type peptidyl-prolyl cis-trans isomerase